MTQEQSFVEAVAAMRMAQKRYFKDRTQQALLESKRLEKEVDRAVELLLVIGCIRDEAPKAETGQLL